jgi:hypothetical protein
MGSMISDIKRKTWSQGISEQSAEENVWTEEGWNDGTLQKIYDEELHK